MRFSRLTLRLMALPALTALLHAQSLVCCWNMPDPQKPVAAASIDVNGMAADHSCCQKQPVDTEGLLITEPGMGCGFQALDAALVSAGPITDFEAAPGLALTPAEPAPAYFAPQAVIADTGPPRFLSLRRLLI